MCGRIWEYTRKVDDAETLHPGFRCGSFLLERAAGIFGVEERVQSRGARQALGADGRTDVRRGTSGFSVLRLGEPARVMFVLD